MRLCGGRELGGCAVHDPGLVATTGGVGEVELLGTHDRHEGVEDEELTGSEGANHDATGAEAKADEHSALTTGTSLVDLGQEGIGRVGDDGGGHTSDHAGGDGDAH